MFYQLKARVLKSNLVRRLVEKARRLLGRDLSLFEVPDELKERIIERYARGKSFADIGCMWRVNGYFSFLAERAGATSVAAVDIYPANEAFMAESSRLDSRVEFIQGDIHSTETIRAIGSRDVVFCSGLLYHTPNPVDTLMKLRLVCHGTLILNTSTVPEMPGIKNFAVFYPYLDAGQRRIWNLGEGALGISTPYDPGQGYANWFWGFSYSCLESMLQCAGFRIIERYGLGYLSCVVCEAMPDEFLPVSGDWTLAPTTKSPLSTAETAAQPRTGD